MRTVLCAMLALASLSFTANALAQAAPPAVERKKFDPTRDAEKDIADAIKLATKQNRRIILDVGGEWCGWCKKLDEFFLTNQEAAKILREKYIVVKVNWSQENKNEKALSKYPKVEAFPHLFVLDKKGKLLHSQDTGLLETGDHHDADKVLPFLKKWAG